MKFSHKSSLLVALLLPAAVFAQAPAPSAPPKFAYVDSRAILQRAPGSAAIQAQIAKERTDAQASVSKMQDSLRDAIEQVAVVRNDEDRPAELAKELLEPRESFEIEVVAGLIENEQVGFGKQCLG